MSPDFAHVHQELKRAGVTLMLLWEGYARGNEQAYKYTSFCVKYRAFAQGLKRSMRQTTADWIGAQIRALEFIGGVPRLIVPDPARALIKNPDR